MTSITTLASIKKLEERYPFNEEELEVIARANDHLKDMDNADDFLMTLAKALPYAVFFLPWDEMRFRVEWIEDHLLPMGFSSRFRCAISADSFVDYANQGQDKSLERLVEGIADTGRRGSKEALRVTFDILDEDATPEALLELCVSLAIAAEALIVPTLDKDATLRRLKHAKTGIVLLGKSLEEYCKYAGFSKRSFIDWAEASFPHLSSALSTFVHNLLFHGHAYPAARIPYTSPKVDQPSDIFENDDASLLLPLSFTSNNLGGKVCLANHG
jgi:hypothetical protein